MNIKPLRDRLVVRPLGSEEKTASGIYIPTNAREQEKRGEVVKIGVKVREISVGEKVLYSQHSGTEVTIDSVTYIVLNESDILCAI